MTLFHFINEVISTKAVSSDPLLFRAAIFICGGVPFTALEDMGLDLSPVAHEVNRYTGALLNGSAGRLIELAANLHLIKRGFGLWDYVAEHIVHNPSCRPKRSDVFGLDFTKFPESACLWV